MRVFLSSARVFLGALLFLIPGAPPTSADDIAITTSFSCVGGGACAQQTTHADAEPYKGWINLTVTNTGAVPWGDFHFEIFQVGLETVENVHFDVSAPNQPTSSQSGLSWVVDNVSVGATLDLFFLSDPVLPSETATFDVYTDNTTDQVSFFGTLLYPSPVPEPGTLVLVGSGLLGLSLGRRRRRI